MAVTYRDLISAQAARDGHVGVNESGVVVSTPDPKRSFEEKYLWRVSNLGSGSPARMGNVQMEAFTDSGGDFVHMFGYVRFPTIDPQKSEAIFMACWTDTTATGTHWSLRWNASGDLILRDANSSSVVTVTGVFSADTWYKVRVKWVRDTAGAFQVWVDEPTSPTIDESSVDSQSGSSANIVGVLGNSSMVTQVIYVYHGTAGIASATATGDVVFEGDIIAMISDGFADVSQGTASQWTTSGFNSALDSGRWDNTDDLLDTTKAVYDIAQGTAKAGGVTTDDGARKGPRDIIGAVAVLGASWVWRFKRVPDRSFLGDGISVYGLYGKQVFGSETTANVSSVFITSSSGTTGGTRKFRPVGSSEVPAVNEWFQIGMKGSLGELDQLGDLEIYHMSALIFLEDDFDPPPSTGGLVYVGSGVMAS